MLATPLTTKLYVPPPSHTLVLRHRLTSALSNALSRALTLVSAPAGYGKTTLVCTWLREADVPSAWLSLDEGDNDPIRFLQYLITTLQKIVPAIQIDMPGTLQGIQPAPFGSLVNLLINEIAEHPASFVLVLDDFYVIQAQPILEMLTFLIEHMPPQMHLVFLTRIDPPLPLSRLRARNQLIEIRAEQLRFTSDEIAVFLNEVMGLKLSADDIAAMEARTEGWIAGLQLAALSMQGCEDTHRFVSTFTGSHYYIMDYLVEEVLKVQPQIVRSFLLQTSILDRMCGPLCDAVVEGRESNVEGSDESRFSTFGSQDILEYLERSNLFLIPLDSTRTWFRYHHLFADVLNRHLERHFPHQLPGLRRRASQWYEQNGFVHEAIQHALIAGDPDRAARLIEQNGCHLIMRGETVTLMKWIDAVDAYTQAHPWLAIQKAWALSITGHQENVEKTLQAAEVMISPLQPTLEVQIMLGTIAAARAHSAQMQGDTRLAENFARQALEYLPESNPFSCSLRGTAISILGDASWMNGNLEEAGHAYTEAVHIGQAADNIHLVIIFNSKLADILVEQGQLHQAARIYSDSLEMAARPEGQRSPLADRVYAGLSRISYEWNHLEAVSQYVHQCIEISRQWGNFELMVEAYLMLARLEHAQGNLEKAQEAMRIAEQLVSEHHLYLKRSIWVQSALARLWIAQGNLEKAASLVWKSGITIDDEISYSREPEYLTLLHLLVARGDYDPALALSGRMIQPADEANRMGQVIEILILRALAFQGKKDMAQAAVTLERAVRLAQPEGYVRVFLDAGEPMYRLLKACRLKAEDIFGQFVENLFLAFYRQASDQRNLQPMMFQSEILIEPLSARELEVLKLIEAGYSNQDIAAKLVISIATIKRHISNIYTKLGVKSRTQAISMARELSLFE